MFYSLMSVVRAATSANRVSRLSAVMVNGSNQSFGITPKPLLQDFMRRPVRDGSAKFCQSHANNRGTSPTITCAFKRGHELVEPFKFAGRQTDSDESVLTADVFNRPWYHVLIVYVVVLVSLPAAA